MVDSFTQFACSINSRIEFRAFKCNDYDVELNPESYEIARSVQGSYNQVNVALFGETAGRQCACNVLFSICWSVVPHICNWKSVDLDYILVEGDKLCKSLKCRDYFNPF